MMKAIVYWDNFGKNGYLQGVKLRFNQSEVFFDNPLMPPSFVIKKWTSKTNYQAHRQSPTLPLLKRGRKYHLVFEGKSSPEETVYVKIEYFNLIGESIGFDLLKKFHKIFTFPEQAFSYEISLINAGCRSINFKSIHLYSDPEEIGIDHTLSIENRKIVSGQDIYVVFSEGGLVQSQFSNLTNLIIIDDFWSRQKCYLNKQIYQFINGIYESHDSNIFVCGYGPYGNYAALQYEAFYPKCKVLQSGVFKPIQFYKRCVPIKIDEEINTENVNDLYKNKQFNSCYAIEDFDINSLVSTLLSSERELVKLINQRGD
ncbi:accessory Sec system protein Asp3 [Streptococcus uberis]|uniref:accessory Sec system protein Asp3 n=1 Tax=Streptococcus uberis TaxID=1349 RepID=UPI00389252AC